MTTQVQQLTQVLKKGNKKALIFDFDETLFFLILPWEKHRQELVEIAMELGIPNDKMAPGITTLTNQIISLYGKRGKEKVYQKAKRFEIKDLKEVLVNKELVDFVLVQRHNYEFFIWSSNMSSTIEPVLEQYNLKEVFSRVVTKDKVDLIKPYPDGFYQIHNPDKYKRSDYIMIGDSQHDQMAAERVGIDFFKIKYF